MHIPLPLFGAKPVEGLTALVFVGLAGAALFYLIGGLVHAACLKLACPLCRLPPIRYHRALGIVLLCDAIGYGFGAVLAACVWAAAQLDGPGSATRVSYAFMLNPVNAVYLLAAAVLARAVVFAQRLGPRTGPPVGFGPAAAVALVYLGLCGLVSAALGMTAVVARAAIAL
jgi:hypothetical protein